MVYGVYLVILKGFGYQYFYIFFQKNEDHLKIMQYAHPVSIIAAS